MLTFCQGCQQNDLAVWEFQRVVMAPRIVWVDLPEDRGLVAADLFFTPRPELSHLTSSAKDNSVPGSTQTATLTFSDAAKPRVPVPKSRVVSLSPTFAGRDLTW